MITHPFLCLKRIENISKGVVLLCFDFNPKNIKFIAKIYRKLIAEHNMFHKKLLYKIYKKSIIFEYR